MGRSLDILVKLLDFLDDEFLKAERPWILSRPLWISSLSAYKLWETMMSARASLDLQWIFLMKKSSCPSPSSPQAKMNPSNPQAKMTPKTQWIPTIDANYKLACCVKYLLQRSRRDLN